MSCHWTQDTVVLECIRTKRFPDIFFFRQPYCLLFLLSNAICNLYYMGKVKDTSAKKFCSSRFIQVRKQEQHFVAFAYLISNSVLVASSPATTSPWPPPATPCTSDWALEGCTLAASPLLFLLLANTWTIWQQSWTGSGSNLCTFWGSLSASMKLLTNFLTPVLLILSGSFQFLSSF